MAVAVRGDKGWGTYPLGGLVCQHSPRLLLLVEGQIKHIGAGKWNLRDHKLSVWQELDSQHHHQWRPHLLQGCREY